jgi:hypothetical protein
MRLFAILCDYHSGLLGVSFTTEKMNIEESHWRQMAGIGPGRKIRHYPANSQYLDLGYPCPAEIRPKHRYLSPEPPWMDTGKYHYCKGRVATQFCSFLQKKSEWIAIHEGSHFDSFRKLCDATDYFANRHFKSRKFADSEPMNIEFNYPILTLQGDLLEAIPSKRGVTFRAQNHLQFRRSSIVNGKHVEYQIDVIRERFLSRYLNIIEQEIEKTARLLRRRHGVVRQSIDRIVQETCTLTKAEEIRIAMNFEQ